MANELQSGDLAPDFLLPADDGKTYSLKDFANQKLILYFYPKDNTPGCTLQATGFAAKIDEFAALGYQIVGVSADTIDCHKRFRSSKNLNFILLSDTDKKVSTSYGVYGNKKLFGKISLGITRSTFLIDGNGKIIKAMYAVKATGHVESLLKELENSK